jgi:1-acyl-sn-glycerol-3-phosphate acyltransferase
LDLIAAGLSRLIAHDVRRQLRGVWVYGALPGGEGGALPGAAVLAPSHHSWWDGYVLREVARACGQPFAVLMTDTQLENYPFLRRVGALGTREVRAARRWLAATGGWLVVFPEGELRSAGPPGPLHPGAAWLARQAGVPLLPVALRVTLRGHKEPEAYLRVGAPVSGDELAAELQAQLTLLDAELAGSTPEEPLAGYLRLLGTARAGADPPDLPSRLLAGVVRWQDRRGQDGRV